MSEILKKKINIREKKELFNVGSFIIVGINDSV